MKGSPVRVRASALEKPRRTGDFLLGSPPDLEHVPNMSRDWCRINAMVGMVRSPTGHVFRVDRARGPVWYAKYRLPDGRQVQRKIGPAWTERGRPAAGYLTKRTAEAWLRDLLDQARHGTLPGMERTGATFADAAAEWLRYIEQDRRRKPSTVSGYQAIVRAHLLPAFGSMPIESITPAVIEAWLAGVDRASSTRVKALVLMHGIFQRARKVWSL